jgi:hypothetical protein
MSSACCVQPASKRAAQQRAVAGSSLQRRAARIAYSDPECMHDLCCVLCIAVCGGCVGGALYNAVADTHRSSHKQQYTTHTCKVKRMTPQYIRRTTSSYVKVKKRTVTVCTLARLQ